jgi:hypothetical protein
MTYRTPWDQGDPGAYGHIKINEIVSYLPLPELEEYERLEVLARTPEQQARMEQLWGQASQAHKEYRERPAEPRTPENDLVLYAAQVGEQMRARRASEGPDADSR